MGGGFPVGSNEFRLYALEIEKNRLEALAWAMAPTIAGTAIVSGIGAAFASGVLSSNGVSAVAALGESFADGVGAIAGLATSNAVASSLADAVATSTGSATVSAEGEP